MIEQIRKMIKKHSDSIYYGDMEDEVRILEDLWRNDKAELVFSDTEDMGGRWTEWEVQVFKITENNVIAYFKVQKEVGKTELQNGEGNMVVEEVKPKEVTTIKYINI